MEKETFKKRFELLYLSIMTVLGLLCIAVGTMSKWNNGVVSWTIFILIIIWAIYLLDLGNQSGRFILYTLGVDVILLYYGTITASFTDVPILVCLFITIVAFANDMRLQKILIAVYPILIVYHFITGYVSKAMGSLAFARMILGLFCIVCTSVFSRYIMQRQMLEEERAFELTERLRLADKKNEQFMTNISHELLTPINAVNGASQIILQRDLEPEVRDGMSAIYSAGKRLNAQISDIMDYSEIITGELVVSDTNYEITSVLNDMVQNFVWAEEYNAIEYAIDVQPDIPSVLYGDPGKLRKIMSVLVENALKSTSVGGVFLKVSKTDESYGINLIIEVFDTGKGMSDEDIASVYKSFDGFSSEKNNHDAGLGIGLMIVYGFVNKMNGSMNIQSREGFGTRIRVSIPQGVINARPSMALANADKYNIAGYFNADKYTRAEIGQYYNEMVDNIRNSLDLVYDNLNSLEELKNAVKTREITHIIVSKWEYDMEPEFFENLPDSIFVVVIVGNTYKFPQNSRIISIRKPLYIQAVINVLRETTPGSMRIVIDDSLVRFDGMKALVVDDDTMNLSVARGILSNYGINVTTAKGGDAAIEKCMFEDFDIIFMDIMMPDMDGIECMNRIRMIRKNSNVNVPIVALTANSVSGARERFIHDGFDEFIPKPIEVSVLVRVLKKFYTGGAL